MIVLPVRDGPASSPQRNATIDARVDETVTTKPRSMSPVGSDAARIGTVRSHIRESAEEIGPIFV